MDELLENKESFEENLDTKDLVQRIQEIERKFDISEKLTAKIIYIGDPALDGSWKITISGSDLLHQRKISGAWVTKDTISG